MEKEEYEKFIASEKVRLIAGVSHCLGWTADDNRIVGRKGGQQVSLSPRGVMLDCKETQFRIFVTHSRSSLTNRIWAMSVYEMYLDEYFKVG